MLASLVGSLTNPKKVYDTLVSNGENDNFKKIIVVKDTMKHWITEEGILVVGIQEFLLDKNSLDL